MRSEKRTRKHQAPGPRGRWLSGNLAEFRRDPLKLMLRAAYDYGDVTRFRFFHLTAHLINHPDLIRHVLVTNHRNYDKQTRSVAKMRAACGLSLLTADGPIWRRHRTIVQPFMRREHVAQFAPHVINATRTMVESWREQARNGRPVEVVSEMMRLVMSITASMFFSADVGGDASTIERSLTVMLDDTWRRLENLTDFGALSRRLLKRAMRRAISNLDDVVNRILTQRRSANNGHDLLSSFLRARDETGQGLDNRELRDLTLTLLLAGHETTANALAWAFYLVSQNAEVEQQVREELTHVALDGTSQIEFDQLPVIRRVFAETLRLYPSIWIMERRAIHEDNIGGWRIPAGSMVLISPYVLHRHPGFWHHPERFDPSRFAGRGTQEVAAEAYLPFGAGPRHCVGRELANFIAPLVLATVLAHYRLRLVFHHPVLCTPGITLRHRKGLPMTVEACRERAPSNTLAVNP